jgi:hypothetical protein
LKIVKSQRYKIYRAKVHLARKVFTTADREKEVFGNVDEGNRILIKAIATKAY